ncbi:lactate racemase domain-containing protein [Parablautia sp. Marseille-Q6255]|uniref:lactate racemase domain-containing protein n=1 Tax=Parablautia sp. Marseille-Q6255 TaxID=3039593 RepID=UPI0024BCCCAD|nr:lactate racemase domain-containing protein [Parablautia sp. Marseille-Q6255]
MNIFEQLLQEVKLPKMLPVEFTVEKGRIAREEIFPILHKALCETGLLKRIEQGKTVAITCGSREIRNIDEIERSVITILKEAGIKPFIFAAMGSHGGANAQGQLEILSGYHVTEETMGVPVVATMDTVLIGKTDNGLEVHMEKNANDADYIIPVGRIKPHTDFRGRIESGLMKMLCIGCGKQKGANICHMHGFPAMSENVTKVARVVLQEKKIPFGIAIIEDAFHNTYHLEVIAGEEIEEREAQLLEIAKKLIPVIPFEKIDVLLLDEIGKDISGSGMDPNVTGRSAMLGVSKPFVERIAVFALSEKSHHNGCGIGSADITTQRFYEDMDFFVSYPNGLTSHDPGSMRIPPVMPNDKCAVQMAIHSCTQYDQAMGHRVVWMKNTLCLEHFMISENLREEAEKNPNIKICGEAVDFPFDEKGNLRGLPPYRYEYGVHKKAKDN